MKYIPLGTDGRSVAAKSNVVSAQNIADKYRENKKE